ncbi:response regulator transcription factor [Paenibacillus sp. SYP-B4298]|uniref:response regulator transcription factor n=1 Tax=Paenibacillus sp. SYP-B4298 TaxID=2996034 RepID=UPI0022DDFB69|nr:response regulator transcription factor [Paenibacillus sp. SYP-B4298]
MEPCRILVADDDREIRELLAMYLRKERYEVDTAANGDEAIRLFGQARYNLVVLDIMMPGIDGIEVCRRLREHTNVPIMMLTAKDQEIDKVLGLTIGADDYMTKPFGIHELLARIKAQIRRFHVLGSGTAAKQEAELRYKGLIIDRKHHNVIRDGHQVMLTAKEFELLYYFASHPMQVFTKIQLFRQVWDSDYLEDDNTVMVHIRKLRKKIERDPSSPQLIQTVWGIGYRFAGEKEDA